MTDFNRPLTVGTYKATASFQSAPSHVAVMFDDDCTLVAVTGYADDPENVQESYDYARLFAFAPDMLRELRHMVEVMQEVIPLLPNPGYGWVQRKAVDACALADITIRKAIDAPTSQEEGRQTS